MAELLVDTDVCVDHLEGVRRLPSRKGRLGYSVITRCELLAGPSERSADVRRLLAPLEEFPIDRKIADRAGELRRENGLRTPDALIAATALVRDLTLLTRNLADFRRAPGLRVRGR